MKLLLQYLLLVFISVGAIAADFSYNGVKPAVIIDVRTPAEFAAGHIDGAINIPHEQITEGIQSIGAATKESPILIYCYSGRRAAIAVTALEQLGFQQLYNGGGMTELQTKLQPCTATSC
ncbi:rhodanese-like domain-containing protein [Iodobacter ciconiae]|uniref:Rhodanese-like domain-containing protein n=1 Tax=Iodobacter ciconiae TaxID=2496266 RepID=A0A3S8ZW74_9NEIS|nr:rhodanese-like domain-containing protein [Iodobacter ciconiae]AZN37747.1 rhodanese-like domain-containing protein [Iodobacter ciconiae]